MQVLLVLPRQRVLVRPVRYQLQVARRWLRVRGVRAPEPAAMFGFVGREGGREERVRFEGRGVGFFGHSGAAVVESVAIDQDIMVGGAAAFSRDDMGVVGGCHFVNDADHAFFPAVFVVVCVRGLLVKGRLGGEGEEIGGVGLFAQSAVGEAGLCVGDAGEIEGHS